MSNAELMALSLRKAHKVLFGTEIEIMMVTGSEGDKKYQPVSYVPIEDPRLYEDQLVVETILRFPAMNGYMIIVGDRLDFHVQEAIKERDHIKPIMVVWSIGLKVIWDKVRMIHRIRDASTHLLDELLTAEQIAACLPPGFEFINPPQGWSNQEIIDDLLDQEFDGHCIDLRLTEKQIDAGVAGYLAERAVITKLALLCHGEGQMLLFLKKCYDLTPQL